MRPLLKRIIKRALCKHEYEMLANFSYRKIENDRRFHEITVKCAKCGKKVKLPRFSTPENSGLN